MRKLFLENFFSLFLILTISLIVFFIGINDIEEYSLGSFSSKILWNNKYGLFTFFMTLWTRCKNTVRNWKFISSFKLFFRIY